MRVLIGCEESGNTRRAFRGLGAEAFSCDLVPARDGGEHLQMDVLDALEFGSWDLIILHPPCTALAVSGNRWYGKGSPREELRKSSLEWTKKLWEKATSLCPRVALENPVSVLSVKVLNDAKKQIIHPWQFGHPETKTTVLFLKGLPDLKHTEVVTPVSNRIWRMPPSPTRARDRSETYSGVSDAFANQWGSPLLKTKARGE